MKFDKSKVFTSANADEAEKYIGKKGWFADSIEKLIEAVTTEEATYMLVSIYDGSYTFRFGDGIHDDFNLFYPYEPELTPFDWEHRELLMNKWVRNKVAYNQIFCITRMFVDIDDNKLYVGAMEQGEYINSVDLLNNYEFLDGSAIGMET